MKIEITEIEIKQALTMNTNYIYDFFIDNVLIAGQSWSNKQEPIKVYRYFISELVREWKTKYKRKYDKELGQNHKNGQEKFNPKTIICEEIQDLDLTLKQARQFVREQKIMEDF